MLLNRGAGANLHRGAAVFVVKFAPNQGAGFVKYQQFYFVDQQVFPASVLQNEIKVQVLRGVAPVDVHPVRI